jgi:hypothetical protein
MVLLTVTTAIAAAVADCKELAPSEFDKTGILNASSPAMPAVGDPISHRHLIELSKVLKKCVPHRSPGNGLKSDDPYNLHALLCGSSVYIPPRKLKPEPVSNYPRHVVAITTNSC